MNMILMDLLCWFCGNSFQSEMPERWTRKVFMGCERCYMDTSLKAGSKVVYGAYDRNKSNAVLADKVLERDQAYTIRKITRWQHGTYLTLHETGNQTFDYSLFVPADFDLNQRVCGVSRNGDE